MHFSTSQRADIINEVSKTNRARRFVFGGLELLLNKHTLVPHPDTLQLIQIALKIIRKHNSIRTIADVGTGTGIIALSLAAKFPTKSIFASDASPEALQVAKKNAVLHKNKNIHFLFNKTQDWLSEYGERRLDLIVSNPPFVGETEFNDKSFLASHPEVKLEPKSAIVTQGDTTGFDPYFRIIEKSKHTKTRFLLFQCNATTIKRLASKIQSDTGYRINIINDRADNERFLFITTVNSRSTHS